ncbi:tRNA (guanine37-N1)-methyltransferase [Paucidesulfovibrio gracilis DSM 16080]|uniref:tRNA (guanine-N(1)-)-methyltransferase n=1 Tax=Paucidesulfovibrio gracilis DSM 16080 TaxID=1121449 RepID=A0A1T4XLS7_9BACT|nr:tRNA (guanosine(37)-N1)-methyltransferase TrmD [Paucidesulfovibrio gracilis]SKA90464.1 tRNA (guanine37-N1)-methyltransferase [Paucidesulfovibrio gracilis DSM 16080]
MHFNIVTIFPEFFDSALSVGLLGKAVDKGLVTFERVSPRSQTTDRHQTVDDKPYGGGAGLVMLPDPLTKTLRALKRPGRMLMLSPRGRRLTQEYAGELAQEEALTLICGRYEGIDERILDLFPVELVNVGDAVLNGGEAAAQCVVEAVSRLLPEFMHKEESLEEESFSSGLLEYPHYTRPDVFEGHAAPAVLLSGDHGKVASWRREQSVLNTLRHRPELLASAPLEPKDVDTLKSAPRATCGRNLHLALVHYPVLNKFGDTVAVSLTNLDIHDMSRVSRSYALGGLLLATPIEDQRELAANLLRHWTGGAGGKANPDRAEAMRQARVVSDLSEAVAHVEERTGQRPRIVATSARIDPKGGPMLTPEAVRRMLDQEPVLLVFGTGSGLAPQALEGAEMLRPLRCLDDYNHLSVRSAVAITVDRILGDVY